MASKIRNISLVSTDGKLVELGGNLFKKQILRFGEWFHHAAKNGKLVVDRAKVDAIVKNFDERTLENLPVYRGHAKQDEVEKNPTLHAGYVEKLEIDDTGLWAIMNLSDDAAKQAGTVYKNVSAAIEENYVEHETGKARGSVLRHIALVIEPYIKKLVPDFIPLSEDEELELHEYDLSGETLEAENVDKTEGELLDTTIPAPDKPEDKEEPPAGAKEVGQNGEKEKEQVEDQKEEPKQDTQLSEIEMTDEEKAQVELIESKNREIEQMTAKLAEAQQELVRIKEASVQLGKTVNANLYETLLSEGRVIPVQKDAMLKILESTAVINLGDSGEEVTVAALFREFLEKQPKVVDLTEIGTSKVDSEIPGVPVGEVNELKAYYGMAKKPIPQEVIEELKKKYASN